MATDSEETTWPWWILGALVLAAIVIWACHAFGDPKTDLELAGEILQLAGIALAGETIVEALYKTGRLAAALTGFTKLLERAQGAWDKLLGPAPADGAPLEVDDLHQAQDLESVQLQPGVRPLPGAPVEDRVKYLEEQLEGEVERANKREAQLTKRMEEERQQVHKDLTGLQAAVDDVRQRLHDLPAQGAGRVLAGTVWAFVGTVLQILLHLGL